MKIIFLDFDGVIVHSKCNKDADRSVINHMDPACVQRIMNIARVCNARIVIESTWIWLDKYQFICKRLLEAGFDLSLLHIDWCAKGSHDKGIAIEMWLDDHKATTQYVVIEDGLIIRHISYLVQVKNGWMNGGITDKHASQAIKLLK